MFSLENRGGNNYQEAGLSPSKGKKRAYAALGQQLLRIWKGHLEHHHPAAGKRKHE